MLDIFIVAEDIEITKMGENISLKRASIPVLVHKQNVCVIFMVEDMKFNK